MSRASLVAVALVTSVIPVVAQPPGSQPDPEALTAAGTRQVHVTPSTIVALNTHLRFSTLIMLPSEERILEVHAGDKEFWQVSVPSPSEHTVSVKPSKAGASTNLDLFCASGNVYSFLVTDISRQAKGMPDLKVFVSADEAMRASSAAPPRYVPAEDLRHCEEQAAQATVRAQATHDLALADYPTTLQFDYRFDDGGPHWIEAVWRDHRRTYIRTRATELPTVYEVKDGEPSLIQFEVRDGQTYVIPKVLDKGYLAIGSKRAEFRREQR